VPPITPDLPPLIAVIDVEFYAFKDEPSSNSR
jgi:hypothetical protein